jgi:hypothetical protein
MSRSSEERFIRFMTGTALEQRSFSSFLTLESCWLVPLTLRTDISSSIPYDDDGEGSEERRAIGSASNRQAAYLPVRGKFVDIY